MKILLETNVEKISEFYLQTLVLLYCPCEVFGKNDTASSELFCRVFDYNGKIEVFLRLSDNGRCEEIKMSEEDTAKYPDGINIPKAVVGKSFCVAARKVYGFVSPFGIITGIRPAKLALSYLEKGFDRSSVVNVFKNAYMMEEKKARTLTEIAEAERGLLHTLPKNSFSLYVSIPFCPTRCSYCSFVSYSTDRLLGMIPDYIVRLFEDIRLIGKLTTELGLKLYSVYVGGGTPSILSADTIKALVECVHNSFDMSDCHEFTFEAGRPDTVTLEKLLALRDGGVGRISLNTQTANNDVLRLVGRNHTFEDYLEKLTLARSVGFKSINTDLIAGLPGESLESFKDSIDKVIDCDVENITVHSLTLKKSSDLRVGKSYELLSEGMKVRNMLDYAASALCDNLYLPYYIYRQKNTVGNLENTGYAQNGTQCLYNILMMEEFHSVFSAGAGAVTKLVSPDRKYIERLFEQKYPYEYLGKSEKRLDTEAVKKFYAEYFDIK